MRLSLRFLIPLALALGAIAYGVVPLVDELTQALDSTDDDCLWHPDYREALDKISAIVLAYRPKAKSKPARSRKRWATKIAKEKV